MENTLDATLEQLVDHHTLKGVLAALTRVCGDKASHVQEAWQDKQTARMWEKACQHLDVLTENVIALGV